MWVLKNDYAERSNNVIFVQVERASLKSEESDG